MSSEIEFVTLTGTVVNSSGSTVGGATVDATKSGATSVSAKTTTSSDGWWTLELDYGVSYTLTATKSGESDLTVKVESGVDSDSISVNIGFTVVQASY